MDFEGEPSFALFLYLFTALLNVLSKLFRLRLFGVQLHLLKVFHQLRAAGFSGQQHGATVWGCSGTKLRKHVLMGKRNSNPLHYHSAVWSKLVYLPWKYVTGKD